jgi:membrane associated rhomboid family serine protease
MYWDDATGLRGFEFWRFISFQFLHANLSHLLFNMIGLYFFGSIVEQYLGSKRYLAFYLLCGVAGAAAATQRGHP